MSKSGKEIKGLRRQPSILVIMGVGNSVLSECHFFSKEPLGPDEPGVTLDIGTLGNAFSAEALRRAQSFFAGQDL